jgi:hypothetical protein
MVMLQFYRNQRAAPSRNRKGLETDFFPGTGKGANRSLRTLSAGGQGLRTGGRMVTAGCVLAGVLVSNSTFKAGAGSLLWRRLKQARYPHMRTSANVLTPFALSAYLTKFFG